MPLCEALSSCRGRGPHHVHKDRVGTWELSCLTTGHVPTWSASGRRGAVADDARAREVGLRHSSCEAGEQSGAPCCGAIRGGGIRSGAGGAKGGDQGKCGPANHALGTSKPRALDRIREVARERKKEKFISLFHHISIDLLAEAFYQLEVDAAPGVDRLMWKDYEAELERNLEDFAQPGPKWSVSGAAKPAGVHPQAGWPATPARGRCPGGQDRPTGCCRAAERDPRGRVPRHLVWVPAWA